MVEGGDFGRSSPSRSSLIQYPRWHGYMRQLPAAWSSTGPAPDPSPEMCRSSFQSHSRRASRRALLCAGDEDFLEALDAGLDVEADLCDGTTGIAGEDGGQDGLVLGE
jgi:hypothetical protein